MSNLSGETKTGSEKNAIYKCIEKADSVGRTAHRDVDFMSHLKRKIAIGPI